MQLTQAEFMRDFNDTHREKFNELFFKRDNEETVNGIYEIVRSCERDKYFTIRLLSFKAIYDYEEIYNTLREHEEKRRKKNSKVENSYDYINIKDTDMILIKLEWLIRHNGVERIEEGGKTVEVVNPQEILEVLVAIPRFVRGYYFRLAGNYYTTTFQIVDGSTYNNSTASQSKVDTVTEKAMFTSIRIFRSFNKMVDIISGTELKVIEYQSIIFNKNVVNALYYIFANYGMYGTTHFLEIDCVTISKEPINDPNFVCFEKNGIYIYTPKYCFQDHMVQAMMATIYDAIMKETTIEDLFNQRYWIKFLGMAFKNATIDKGLARLDFIDGIYDNITKRYLHLPEEEKFDSYALIRWVIREFSALRIKENTDVRTKRIRISDCIAAVYANKLNSGLYRIFDMGSKVTLKKIIQAIYTQPMYIMNTISTMSNLFAYRDLVNDNDAMVALKWTYKGISGLGEDGGSVQPIYRYVDTSHVGILDLDASSTSDPGMSGMLCPMAKIYDDNSFSEYQEPNNWKKDFAKIEKQYHEGKIQPIHFNMQPTVDEIKENPYLSGYRKQIEKEELEINKIIVPIKNIDPNIDYTVEKKIVEQEDNEPVKSLFTIRES